MAVKPKNIKWNPVNKSFRSPKFQKKAKSKFKENLPKSIKNKTFLKGEKIEKIKLAFKKSKIKDKKAIITLNKKAYNNKQTMDFVDSSFSELIKSKDKVSIQKFFDIYRDLFYDIPKKGEKSHESLIIQSKEYINDYVDWRDAKIEQLLDELELKEDELSQKQNPTTAEHIFYTNGTFLRTHGMDTEYVEGVPQGLPIWVMQEGARREFKSYDAYKIAKRAAGFTNMWWDEDKQELMGDKDIDITEKLHQNDLNYLPTGRDINSEADLNLPSGPDRKIDVDLSSILDYYYADLTCLEGYDDPNDQNQVKTEDYSPSHDGPENCYVKFWTLDGTRISTAGFSPGTTIQKYFRKDNPDVDITDMTLGLNSNILQQQAEGEEDGIFGMKGYIRFNYNHPENTPTKYVNVPFSTKQNADTLPTYIEPTYSDYGTRMFDKMGYGDQRKSNGEYVSRLSDEIWEQVLSDPLNAFYNGDHDWRSGATTTNINWLGLNINTEASACNGCEEIGETIRKGGGYNSVDNYDRIYEDGGKYYQYLGSKDEISLSTIFGDHYYVILNKNYNGHSPLSGDRVVKVSLTKHLDLQKQYKAYTTSPTGTIFISSIFGTNHKGGAYRFSEAYKFPQDHNGYYIPKEYWDEFGLTNTNY